MDLRAVAQWVWDTSVSATVLVALIAVAQLMCSRIRIPRLWLALWWLVALRLALPSVPASPTSVFNLLPFVQRTPAPEPALIFPESATVSANINADQSRAGIQPAPDRQDARPTLWLAAAYLWLVGALTLVVAVLFQQRRLQRSLRHDSEPPAPALANLLQEACKQLHLRRNVSLLLTTAVDTPAAFGVIHPCVLLPRRLGAALSQEELRLLLLHELVHIKRHHVLQNWVLILLQAIHWFNPAIWYAFRRLRSQRELVCDAAVLGQLPHASRQLYGATLIRLAELAARPLRLPGIVPILSHKKQIHRRIHMISAYKPMTRLAVIGSALTVAALACVFLTGAADKTTPPTSTDAAKAQVTEPNSGKEQQDAKLRFDRHGTPIDAVTFAHQRKLLRHEFEKLSATVQQQSQKVDRLKEELQISDLEEAAFEKPDSEPLRRLESLRMDATADYQAINTLYVTLTNLSRAELLRALPTASPDALLQELLSRQSAAEQAQAEGIQKYGADHPENKMRQRALKEIVNQIDERADAVLYGIKTRIAAQKATLDHLQTEFVKAKEYQIARTIRQRPYFQAKRDLQTLEAARDRLHERLLQTEVDAALAPAGSAR